jgi:prevent-host-death family protein
MARTLSISEARRLLPQLVDEVSRDGGRVDITRRGKPTVSILRTAEVERTRRGAEIPSALRVEFSFDPADLVDVIRELRSRIGHARPLAPGQQKGTGR